MTPTNEGSYEFGEFRLNAVRRELLFQNNKIALDDRDLDVLLFLVRHPKELIPRTMLQAAVWGEAQVPTRNLNHHISQIRKALGCDPRSPTFIRTAQGRGYRFLVDVKHVDDAEDSAFSATLAIQDEYLITSHLFAPVYLGEKVFKTQHVVEKQSRWGSYKEIRTPEGRLCVFPNGVGVWHLTKVARFPSMSVTARWRQQTYEQILDGRHPIRKVTEELIDPSKRSASGPYGPPGTLPGYVLSLLVLDEPRLGNMTRIKNILQLLSCPSPLESKVKLKKEVEISLERQLLGNGLNNKEMYEFGVGGTEMGFACWDGVSFYHSDRNSLELLNDLIELEIAVQGAWWSAKCLTAEISSGGKLSKANLGRAIEQLKEMMARVEDIGAQDTPSQRSMIEAILTTSRLERLVTSTIKRFDSA